MNGNKRNRFKVVLVIILIIGLFSTGAYFSGKNHVEDEKPYTYDQVVTQIKEGEVTRVEAYTGDSSVKITLEDGSEKTVIVPSIDLFSELVSAEIENGSEIEFEMFKAKSGGILSSIFSSLFTIFLYIIIFSFVMRRMTASIGGDNTEFKPVTSKTTFKDVAGIDEEREQLQEVVDFLKNPRKFIAMGAKIPKGVIAGVGWTSKYAIEYGTEVWTTVRCGVYYPIMWTLLSLCAFVIFVWMYKPKPQLFGYKPTNDFNTQESAYIIIAQFLAVVPLLLVFADTSRLFFYVVMSAYIIRLYDNKNCYTTLLGNLPKTIAKKMNAVENYIAGHTKSFIAFAFIIGLPSISVSALEHIVLHGQVGFFFKSIIDLIKAL